MSWRPMGSIRCGQCRGKTVLIHGGNGRPARVCPRCDNPDETLTIDRIFKGSWLIPHDYD